MADNPRSHPVRWVGTPGTEEKRKMIYYHASHEQFPPGRLLELSRAAEDAGFEGITSSDHFNPWSSRQGQSGFALSWLGASLQATGLPHGMVTAPGWRYHPAILAQAGATLAEMFPGRFWMALGSGELLNEGIVGERWPAKAVRNEVLCESAGIIRALWAGETVTSYGLVRVEEARLHTLPEEPPMLIGAAITPETAEWVAGWADGLITNSGPREKMEKVVEAFRRGGGEGKPMILKLEISYAESEESALRSAWEEWKTNIFESSLLAQLRTPAEFEAAARYVIPEDMRDHVRIAPDLDRHVEWLREDLEMGFTTVTVHNVNREQERFIRDFGPIVSEGLSTFAETAEAT
jgi:coenzyme F420-dependent glucose-6-phosphate dehydrogenase